MRSSKARQESTPTKVHVQTCADGQLFLVASCSQPAPVQQAAADAYEKMADVLAGTTAQIVHERVFGNLSVERAVMAVRREAFLEKAISPAGPVTYVEGCPPWGEGFAGAIIHAVAETDSEDAISTVTDGRVACGRRWTQNGCDYLMLQDIHGTEQDLTKVRDPSLQARSMFDCADRLLRDQGFTYRQVVRTWFYLTDILRWYPQFNQIRSAYYKTFGIMPDPGAEPLLLPSSTGIQGTGPHRSACTMDLMAVAGSPDAPAVVRHMSNPGQEDAFRYGSAFSRGTSIRQGHTSLIHVSGTAAIDKQGRSLYPGDVRAQIDCTLDKIEALIGQEGATLKGVCAATVFVKRPEDISAYRDRVVARGLDSFPAVCIVADVCREELLFEIDAEVASIGAESIS